MPFPPPGTIALKKLGCSQPLTVNATWRPSGEIAGDPTPRTAMTSSNDSLLIVKSTIDLAHGLGLSVVAEGSGAAAALEAVNDLLAVLDTTVDAESAEAGRLSVEPRPVDVGGIEVRPWFAPEQGEALAHRIAKRLGAAKRRIRLASPVLSSGPILGTLAEVCSEARVDVAGVIDDTQVDGVLYQWALNGNASWKVPALRRLLEAGFVIVEPLELDLLDPLVEDAADQVPRRREPAVEVDRRDHGLEQREVGALCLRGTRVDLPEATGGERELVCAHPLGDRGDLAERQYLEAREDVAVATVGAFFDVYSAQVTEENAPTARMASV